MHWFREILVCTFLAEFITLMLFTISLVPTTSIEMVVGRVLLGMYIILILMFVIWYSLIYDKKNDRLRKS